MANYRIAVDAMGGDNAPEALVAGAINAARKFNDVEILLFGREEALAPLVKGEPRVKIYDARDVIGMHDSPMLAVRKMPDSSMVRAVMALREGAADAVISAGSTGALLAAGMFKLGRIPGIERPALAPVIPGRKKPFLLIDCGANVDCQAKYLEQFGLMGSIYMQSVFGVSAPEVGLVNIGTEDEKGDKLTKEAFGLMQAQTAYKFSGNVEAREVMTGEFDVCVADGFVGNIILKNTEGTISLLMGLIREAAGASLKTKIGALLMKSAFRSIKSRMDYQVYGGAPLLGVCGAMIKAHGSSKASAIESAVRQARDMVAGNVVEKIKNGLSGLTE